MLYYKGVSLVLQAKMFKILVKVVKPHLYRYEVSLTSKYMFKNLSKSCYRSLSIGTGMLEQILKTVQTGQTVQRQQYFPFYQHVCGKSGGSQISESQICIIQFFSKAIVAEMASVSI